ncbi:TIGR00730 family Rossman fold protein [Actinobacteria bacterium YIM 96077]|uniref:Cytokinin riboside 5'-monophosphate phosphoribohydrolase n=1 Tax=Phytoactinopolyspora halophila TaxID=1981511 RepID=A0A329R137_9ACTN|nr:TIGR00730 family Rossman fold protein [Actinobacteria bacterium YIM 96077]RAW17659.1 TIGR00730 family Rossman fold protein [Phytoactinopolyspora halophila]
MRRICVFCGSTPGRRAEYQTLAEELGTRLATDGFGLVYGGAHVGTMGAVSGAALARGGEVIGVIPQSLVDREVARHDVTELHVVDTMHERKALMNQLSDAFIVLAGGLGTFEELFEVATWSHLGLQSKPVVLLDRSGYFDPLVTMLDHALAEGFLKPASRALIQYATDVDQALKLVSSR